MTIKLKDIAKRLNISESAVSRALSDHPRISDKTKKRVKETARLLNYQPNLIAKSLKLKQTKTIGLVVSDITNPYYPEIIKGAEDVANENGLNIILCNSDYNALKEKNYLNVLFSKMVDGVLLTPTGKIKNILSFFDNTNLPFVLIDIKPLKDYQINCVFSDLEYGAYVATNKLIEYGHTKIALINGPKTISPCQQLEKGFRKALNEKKIPINENYLKECNLKIEGGRKATKKVLSVSDEKPTAILNIGDKTAEGGYLAIKELGLSIPNDISIFGYDDIPEAKYFLPPLSTVRQPKYDLGAKSMNLLLNNINNKKITNEKIRLLPELIIRQSIKQIN